MLLFVIFGTGACRMAPWRWGNGTEKGLASWYGNEYHGCPTASGQIFNEEAMTAAHRKLPFGTVVRVKNLKNGKTVKVTITDRGPFIRGRIIDLSKGAAREIGMLNDGVVPARIEVVKWGHG